MHHEGRNRTTIPDTMHAIRLHMPGPEGLVAERIDVPRPATGEALVRVHAAAITRDELEWPTDRLPAIPSYELSGVVAAVASESTAVAVGEEVYALTPFDRDGVAAEYASLCRRGCSLRSPLRSTTSRARRFRLPRSPRGRGSSSTERLEHGQRVLIHGAAGGVGHLATQLARSRGAYVIGTASPRGAEDAKGFGAHEVLDHTSSFEKLEPVDLVFDTVGGEHGWALRGDRAQGWKASVSVAAEPPELDVEATYFVVEPSREQLAELTRLVDGGDLQPSIDSVFPLAEARAAFERSWRPASVARSSFAWPMSRQETKAEAFRALHEGEPFVLPNPWDAGSARVLAALGFKALATTSSGFAFTLGRRDGTVTLEEVVEHAAALDRATELPVSVDLENGYGPEPESAATRDRPRRRRPGRSAARSRTTTRRGTSTGSSTPSSGSPRPWSPHAAWLSRSR